MLIISVQHTFNMKNIILAFLFVFPALAQVGPPPASVAEIAAGTDTYKYVTPHGLANGGGQSNGIAAATATNIAAYQALIATNNLSAFVATQSGLAAGSYSINGQPITNFLSVLAQLQSGAAKTSRSPGSHADGGNNASNYVVSAAGNQGILKTLFCMLDVGSTGGLETNINNMELLIYTDGTAAGNLTAQVKVADLLNCYYRYPSTNWTIRNSTRFLDYYTDPLSTRSGFPMYHFTLNIPMPFTNGMSCKLTNTASASAWTHGYFQAQYELKSLPAELASTRFYITNIHGYLAADASNFLFKASGSTELIGFQLGLSNSNLSDGAQFTADKGISIYLDSTMFRYDLDDWLENTYAGAFGEFLHRDVGWPHNQYDNDSAAAGAVEAYRWLDLSSVRSTNSMTVYTDGFVANDSSYFTFFYYKR